MELTAPAERRVDYCFEGFRLNPLSRTLKMGETEIRLTHRLFETLLAFVASPDATVTSQALLKAVWPDRPVEPGNLARAISSLREILRNAGYGGDLIITVPSKGYRLGCQVTAVPVAEPRALASPAAAVPPSPRAGLRWRGLTTRPAMAALVLVFVGACLSFTGWRDRHAAPAGLGVPRSIAVLPFANTGGTEAGKRLSDGLAATLGDALAGLRNVRVASQQSSFPMARSGASVQEIGRSLSVGVVLQGSVLWERHKIEVTTRLVDTGTGHDIWTHRFVRAEDDLLTLQDELVGALVTSLRLGGDGGAAAVRIAGGASNAQVFELYLKGMGDRSEVDAESNRRAIAEFDETIRLDPNYALAYAQRARALMYAAANGSQADRAHIEELYGQALADATRAIAISPDLGIGHAALGFILKCGLRDIPEAVAEYRRAAALMPGNTTVLMSQAFMEMDLGHIEAALSEGRQAVELNPLTGGSHRMFAALLGMGRQFPEAAAELARASRLSPTDAQADRFYGARLAMMSHDANTALATCTGGTDMHAVWCLAWAWQARGDRQKAADAMQKLREMLGDNGAYEYAELYAQSGDLAQAADWLQVAARLRLPSLIEIKIDPLMDPLKGSSAYQDVVAGLHFPG